jgi:hypothetical protein
MLRVTVPRRQDVVAQKENNSELSADGSNTIEVRINRRSRMLVKHQIALEIVQAAACLPRCNMAQLLSLPTSR